MHDGQASGSNDSRGESGDLLVVGGYGDVGARVSRQLSERHPGRVVVAGRREGAAEALVGQIGNGARARALDVRDPARLADALDDVGGVVMCLDDANSAVLRGAVERGLTYVDITASSRIIESGRRLADRATETGARAVLGIGLAPGVTNLLAALVTGRVEAAEKVEVGVLLSLYDEFGPQALEFMLEAGGRPFPEPKAGSSRRVLPYTEPRDAWFGSERGTRKARWFPFPDQFGFRETLGVSDAATVLALDPPWVDRVMGLLGRLGVLRLSARPGARRFTVALLSRLRGEGELQPVAISAEAVGPNGRSRAMVEVMGESQGTAAALALATARVNGVQPGVWLPEQAFDPDSFLDAFTETTGGTLTAG